MTTPLDAAYNAQILAIRQRIQQFTSARFAWGQYRTADMERFVKEVVPIVLAGRRQVSALTDAYLAQVLSKTLGTRVPTLGPIDTNALRGVSAADVYSRPFQQVRYALSTGATFDAAVATGAERLTSLVATDLQMAKTYTSQNVFSNAPSGIIGYERVPTGANTCALCLVASTQMYHRGDLLPIHPGCNCGILPLTKDNPFDSQAADQRLADTHQAVFDRLGASDSSGRKAIDYRQLIVTHNNSEIGPVLAVRGQHFKAA